MSHWVLTVSVNDYDQHGDYYVRSWDSKPSFADLEGISNPSQTFLSRPLVESLLEKGYASPRPSDSLWGAFTLEEVH